MPFRSKETLERWLAEFVSAGPGFGSAVRVLPQDGSDGSDTGLVVIDLRNAPTQACLEPAGPGDPHWSVTFLAREVDAALRIERLQALSDELVAVAELCRYLERRSTAHLEEHGTAAA